MSGTGDRSKAGEAKGLCVRVSGHASADHSMLEEHVVGGKARHPSGSCGGNEDAQAEAGSHGCGWGEVNIAGIKTRACE